MGRSARRRDQATGEAQRWWTAVALSLAVAVSLTAALAACAGAGPAPAAVVLTWDEGGQVTSSEPLTAVIAVPARAAAQAAGGPVRLFLEGVVPPEGDAVIGLAVFLERPDAAWDRDRQEPGYAGSVAFGQRPATGDGSPTGERPPERFVLSLRRVLDRLGGLAAVGDLEVTLVAVPRSDDPEDVAAFRADREPIRVRRLRLVLGDG